ncbi:MAG TPA: HD domain-containing phosphohydrolase [Vicinamibacterales bacterium]|jgi:putative two-component system response regulator
MDSAKPDTDAGDHPRILVVDDDPQVGQVLRRLLQQDGHDVQLVSTAAAARAAIANYRPDVIVLDVVLPDTDGVSLCRSIRSDARTRLTPVILMTGNDDDELRFEGLAAGADDFLLKPVDTRLLVTRLRALSRLKRYTDDLEAAGSIITTLAMMIEARDGFTEGHCHRMANYATALGRALGLPAGDLQTLHRGGFLHDIGMLAIPDAVLRKPGKIAPEEFEQIKSHTIIGDSICANLHSLEPVRPIVRHHHERLDGTGYPDRLKGHDVPLLAQIIGIVDAYDAVTTDRPYQQAQTPEEGIRLLREHVERGWRNRDLVDVFADVVSHRPHAS